VSYSTKPASDFPPAELAELMTRGFEGYFVPIHINQVSLLQLIGRDSVDITASHVALADEQPVGLALIARRGWSSRVAGMAIIPEWRGRGAGKYLMGELVAAARLRGDHAVVLEVIEQNVPALRLYESFGFTKVRRLAGFVLEKTEGPAAASPPEVDIRELARAIALYALPDLPWQASAETIAQHTPPARAFKLGKAYALISDPEAQRIAFHSLLVEPEARRQGQALALIRALLASYPGKNWHVPAFLPEEVGTIFQRAGFQRDVLSQWQMSLDL
jgi:ribosomal protein S18 acetylase RimI-like enzyme